MDDPRLCRRQVVHLVVSPAEHCAVVCQCTGVVVTRRNRSGIAAQVVYGSRRAAIFGCTVAELSITVVSPAVDTAVYDGTGMVTSG